MKKTLLLQNEEIIEKIEIKIDELVHYLTSLKPKKDLPIGLFSGSAGIAVFLFYYSRYKKMNTFPIRQWNSVNEIDSDLYHGVTGTALYLLNRINVPMVRQTADDLINRLYHSKIEDKGAY
jgi:hypothetical protein